MIQRKAFAVSVLLFVASLWLSGCEDDDRSVAPIYPPFQLQVLELDTVWAYQSPRLERISVRVDLAQIAPNSEMLCIITNPGGSNTHFRLRDDGGFGVWHDSPGFADSISGDASPNDGVFSRRISSRFAAQTGHYYFQFAIQNAPSMDTIRAVVTVRESSDPVIVRFSYPETLPSGVDSLNFIMGSADAEGHLDVSGAEVVFFRTNPATGNYAPFSFLRVADSLWAMNSKPEIAVGLRSGQYLLAPRIQDFYHRQHGDWIWGDTTSIYLENRPPRILEVTGPDTVALPPTGSSDTLVFFYYIRVLDDQTPYDLDNLHLRIFLADTVKKDTAYYDGGGYPDTVALDGIYAAGFFVTAANHDSLEYLFEWTPIDLAGQTGSSYFTRLYFVRDTGNWARSSDPALPRQRQTQRPSPFVSSPNKVITHERKH